MRRIASIVVATLSSSSTTRTDASLTRALRRTGHGERDDERSALTWSASHLHRSAVSLDDAVRDPESKAGALLRLGREERFEDPRLGVFVHADAGVVDLDAHRIERHAALRLHRVPRRHRERAAARHRLSGIEEQVE